MGKRKEVFKVYYQYLFNKRWIRFDIYLYWIAFALNKTDLKRVSFHMNCI